MLVKNKFNSQDSRIILTGKSGDTVYNFQIKGNTSSTYANLKWEPTMKGSAAARLGKAPVAMVMELLDSFKVKFENNHNKYPKTISEFSDEQDKLKRTTNSPLEKNVTTKYKYQIISVDNKEDQTFINNFVNAMNLRDSRAFRTYLEEIEPDVDMKQDFKCRMCGHTEEVTIPITVGFFWPES